MSLCKHEVLSLIPSIHIKKSQVWWNTYTPGAREALGVPVREGVLWLASLAESEDSRLRDPVS